MSAETTQPADVPPLPPSARFAWHGPRFSWLVMLLLGALYLLLRVPNLRAFPIFCDEAMYLRWSQLVRQNPAEWAFVSLWDPKPPLHYWLIALVWPLAEDPLLAARGLSVGIGLLFVPLAFGLMRELTLLKRAAIETGTVAKVSSSKPPLIGPGVLLALLLILCPFLAFYQRLAMAEGVVALQCTAAVWLALRMARCSDVSLGRGLLRHALPFGVLMGAAMLTKQNFCYPLWILPPAAYGIARFGRGWQRGEFRRVLAWWGVALAIGVIVWSPMLLTSTGQERKTRIFYWSTFSKPLTPGERVANVLSHFRDLTVASGPELNGLPTDPPGTPPTFSPGWYWLYLTPPITLAAALALAYLTWRREWRVLALLGLCLLLLLGPVLLLATTLYSRYTLFGAVALLAAIALAWADVVAQAPANRRGTLLLAGVVLLGVWPLHDVSVSLRNPYATPLVQPDRFQYLTGFPAGPATEQALAWLRAEAAKGPLVVLTTGTIGHPADTAWVYLEERPGVTMAYLSWPWKSAMLQPAAGQPGAYSLLRHRGAFTGIEPVELPAGAPVYFVSFDPALVKGEMLDAGPPLRQLNPGIQEVARFHNPPLKPGARVQDVAIWRVK